jgi:hypothetical protein
MFDLLPVLTAAIRTPSFDVEHQAARSVERRRNGRPVLIDLDLVSKNRSWVHLDDDASTPVPGFEKAYATLP